MEPSRLALAIKRVIRARKVLRRRAATRQSSYVAGRNVSPPSSFMPMPASPPPSPASRTPSPQSPGNSVETAVGSPQMADIGSAEPAAIASPQAPAMQGPQYTMLPSPQWVPVGSTLLAEVDNNNSVGDLTPLGEHGADPTDTKSESTEEWSDSESDKSGEEEEEPELPSNCSCFECEDYRMEARDAAEAVREEGASQAAKVDKDVDDAQKPATPDDIKGKAPLIYISDDEEA